ncbi:MAG: hypothetical protein PHN19_00740 [Patescibacteria group bacterium]|nr:hypothetical protein [Patescibacteria group bacterium]
MRKTSALTNLTSRIQINEILVGVAIAIIVLVIAKINNRSNSVFALSPTAVFLTSHLTLLAFTNIRSTLLDIVFIATANQLFVSNAVTIIVQFITFFSNSNSCDCVASSVLAIDATNVDARSFTLTQARRAGLIQIVEIFISVAVAVVVLEVADFSRRNTRDIFTRVRSQIGSIVRRKIRASILFCIRRSISLDISFSIRHIAISFNISSDINSGIGFDHADRLLAGINSVLRKIRLTDANLGMIFHVADTGKSIRTTHIFIAQILRKIFVRLETATQNHTTKQKDNHVSWLHLSPPLCYERFGQYSRNLGFSVQINIAY